MYLTTAEAAERLGISEARVKLLCKSARIKSRKFGRAWAIATKDCRLPKPLKNGRPPKIA